jgi:hypothetical protein
MADPTIGDLFDMLDTWRHFPKYQLERRADLYFALFLPDILESHYGVKFNREVIPEFPLRHATLGTNQGRTGQNQSVNVDYATFTLEGQRVVFVELKTDANSRRTRQDVYLEKATGLEFRTLVDGIPLIREASTQPKKYDVLLDRLSGLGVNEIAHKPEVVYIQPRCDKSAGDKSHGDCICFGRVAESVKTKGPIGERFARSLEEWASVTAGSPRG